MNKNKIAKDIRSAIKKGQLDLLKDLLKGEPEMLTWETPFGTWLHVAVAYGHLEIIKFLLDAGIDVNVQGGTFSTNALERAARSEERRVGKECRRRKRTRAGAAVQATDRRT